MNINIPDKIYKLSILLGLILIGFSFYNSDTRDNELNAKMDNIYSIADSLDISLVKIDYELMLLNKRKISFEKKISTSIQSNKAFEDSLSKINEKLDFINYRNNVVIKKISQCKYKIKDIRLEENVLIKRYYILMGMGFFLFIFGLILWCNEELNPNILIKQNEKLYPCCQSCAKKFSAIRTYGSNTDLTANYAFCKECYQKGKFVNPNLTQEIVVGEAKEFYKRRNKYFFTSLNDLIGLLERWKKNEF